MRFSEEMTKFSMLLISTILFSLSQKVYRCTLTSVPVRAFVTVVRSKRIVCWLNIYLRPLREVESLKYTTRKKLGNN